MTDLAKTEIHPDTLAELKGNLPVLEDMIAEFGPEMPGLAPAIRKCADEMRQRFPGLDDLTLAAIALWEAQKAHALLHMYQHKSWEKETTAAALVAYELAWSIREAA